METKGEESERTEQVEEPSKPEPEVEAIKAVPAEPSSDQETSYPVDTCNPSAPAPKPSPRRVSFRPSIQWTNFIIMAATVVNVALAFFQYRALGDANSAAAVSANAANLSAQAAADANRMNEDFQRARLEVKDERLQFTGAFGGSKAVFSFMTENNGRSVANDVRFSIKAELWRDLPEGAMPEISGPVDHSDRLFEGAKQKYSLLGPEITPTIVQQMQRNESRMFFFGRVRYSTLGRPRESEFCWSFGPDFKADGSIPTIYLCPKWNRRDYARDEGQPQTKDQP